MLRRCGMMRSATLPPAAAGVVCDCGAAACCDPAMADAVAVENSALQCSGSRAAVAAEDPTEAAVKKRGRGGGMRRRPDEEATGQSSWRRLAVVSICVERRGS